MEINKSTAFVSVILVVACISAAPAVLASDQHELTDMLQEFLSTSHTRAAHKRFWADDLVYTSSSGLRFGKADIMQRYESEEDNDGSTEVEPQVAYSGEDIDVRIYGTTAIVAFKLVGTPTNEAAKDDVLYYFNTGTFLKRDGVWQVVAWQATKIPPGE